MSKTVLLRKIGICTFLLLLLSACGGGGAGGGGNVLMEFKIGAIFDPGTVSGGGVMLAHNTTTGGKFSWIIPAGVSTYERTMANGLWNYDVVIWAGPNPLTGMVRCGKTNVNGQAISVPLTLSAGNCSDEFSNNALTSVTDGSGGTLLPLRLLSCSNLDNIPNANSVCHNPLDLRGSSLSFKVELVAHDNLAPVSTLSSACITHQGKYQHSLVDSAYLTDIRLPAGGSITPFIRIAGY
jgi:hypothetical protein